MSEGVICDFGWRGHLEDGKVITCDQAPHPRVTNHPPVSAGKQEKMKVLGNTFSVSMTELLCQQLSSFWMIDSTLSVITRT